MKEKINKGMVFLFFGFFIVSLIVLILKPSKDFSQNENRALAQMPKLTMERVLSTSFMGGFEKYVTDQFYGRDFFVSVKAQSEKAIQKYENNSVYFGKEGYLIEKLEEVDLGNLNANLEGIKKFANYLKEVNASSEVSFLLSPTAANVLLDKLPPFAYRNYQDQMLSCIGKNFADTNINFVSVIDTLLEANERGEQIFYKTDHHWTSHGAYLAYAKFMESLDLVPTPQNEFSIETVTEDFFGTVWSKAALFSTKADSIQRYKPKQDLLSGVEYFDGGEIVKSDSMYNAEYLYKKDKYGYFLDGMHALSKINSSNKNGKKLIVFKDSYANAMVPFLINDFAEIHLIDLRYYRGNVAEYMNKNSISDVLFLYNAATFQKDVDIKKVAYGLK